MFLSLFFSLIAGLILKLKKLGGGGGGGGGGGLYSERKRNWKIQSFFLFFFQSVEFVNLEFYQQDTP